MDSTEPHDWSPRQKLLLIAGIVVAAIVALLALFYGYQRYQRAKSMKGVEQIEELGFGFRRVTIAQRSKFEVGRYPFLYYRNRLLCQIVEPPPSISPSGNYAIYQDPRSGKLMLFRARDEKLTELTKAFIGVSGPVVWHEDQGTVEVTAGADKLGQIFSLQ